MRAAQITDGLVVNIIEVDSVSVLPGLVEAPTANRGDRWDGAQFIKPLAPLPTVADYTAAVQAMLDTEARSHNYDDIVSACSYAAAPNPFQTEGASFVTWRGAVWQKCYAVMAEVQAQARPQPTIAELLAMLPGRV